MNDSKGMVYLANAPIQFGMGSWGRSKDRQEAIDRCVKTFLSDWGRPEGTDTLHVYVAHMPDTDLSFYGSSIWWTDENGKRMHGEPELVEVPLPKVRRRKR